MQNTNWFLVHTLIFVPLLVETGLTQGQTQPLNLTVDTSVRYQTITGFGTALSSLSPTWQPQMQQLYTQDLGASMLRVPMNDDILPGQITFGPDLQSNI